MKKLIKVNSVRHLTRILCALIIALIVNYLATGTQQGWLPFTTVVVMLTSTGSALYQGLWRFLFISIAVIAGSLIFSSVHFLYARMYDVVLGALIGILANLIILPDRVDVEYRLTFIPILKSYAKYFSALVSALINGNLTAVEQQKIMVEQHMQKLPVWIYEAGFDLALQKGYRYFFMKVSQIGEILFAIHHLVRFHYDKDLVDTIREPLLQCVLRVEQFIAALNTVLGLKKLSEGLLDFDAELAEIERRFKKRLPSDLEVASITTTKEYVYLTEFLFDLRELRGALLRLTETLR